MAKGIRASSAIALLVGIGIGLLIPYLSEYWEITTVICISGLYACHVFK